MSKPFSHDMSSLEERIARLEAKNEIQDLVTAFARAADANCDPAMIEPLFTNDAVFDVGSFGRMDGGAQKIAATMRANNSRGFHWTLHYLLPATTKLAPDAQSAHVFAYYWGVAKSHPDNGERSFWVGGSYTAEAVNDDGTWRFRRLNLHLDLLSPFLEGFHGKIQSFDDVKA